MEVGLTINEKKTKYLKCTKQDIRIENLNINSSYTEQVQQYKYLGSIINDSSSIEEEVKRGQLLVQRHTTQTKSFSKVDQSLRARN